jgi:hypothetical protein
MLQTHTLTITHTQSHTHTDKHRHTLTLTLTHTQTHTHAHTLTHTHTHTHTLTHTHTHSHTLTHTLTHSLSHTHTHSHTHTLTHTNTHTTYRYSVTLLNVSPRTLTNEQFVVDGTFKTKPRPWHLLRSGQVYTFNTYYGAGVDGTYTRLYMRVLVLLPSKTEACYTAMFGLLLKAGWDKYRISPFSVQWTHVVCDFEVAITNALQNLMGGLEKDALTLERCHMHYCSAIIKYIFSCGMKVDYASEVTGLRHYISKILALAFAPADAIADLYWWMKEHKVSFDCSL